MKGGFYEVHIATLGSDGHLTYSTHKVCSDADLPKEVMKTAVGRRCSLILSWRKYFDVAWGRG